MPHRIVNPPLFSAPKGWSNGIVTDGGRLLFVAGQIAWDDEQRIVGDDFATQFARALENVLVVVREAGGTPQHVARLTIYVIDKRAYIAARKTIGEHYRRLMDRHYPAMTLVQVSDLLEPGAQVEIEATAVLP